MKEMTIVLAAVFIAVLGISLVCSDSDAAEDGNVMNVTQGGFNYTVNLDTVDLNDPVATLTGWDNTTADVVIPSVIKVDTKIEGKDVELNCRIVMEGVIVANSVIKSLTIEDGKSGNVILSDKFVRAKEGGQWLYFGAFGQCSALTTVKIGNSVCDIADNVFQNCKSITELEISEGVKTIGKNAFYGLGITKITIPSSITILKNSAMRGCGNLSSVEFATDSKLTELEANVFYGTAALTSISLPDSVEKLGTAMFRDSGLQSIRIPASVTSFRESVFSNAKNLTDVEFQEGLVSITGGDNFKNTKVTTIALPNSFVFGDTFISIGYAINQQITEVTFKDDNPRYCSVDGNVFNKEKTELMYYAPGKTISEYVVPDGVTSIGEYAFYFNSNLTKITLNKDVTDIKGHAFDVVKNLTTVEGGSAVKNVGPMAFSSTAITSIDFSSVENIGISAFRTCLSLSAFTFPDTLKSIGEGAFNQTGLANVTVGTPDQCVSIGPLAFWNCKNLESVNLVNISYSADPDAYGMIANGPKLTYINYPVGFDLWSQNGPLQISNDGRIIYSCLQGYTDTVVVPSDVVELSSYKNYNVFAECLMKAVIFENDKTEPILVPASNVFFMCPNLESIVFCDGTYYKDYRGNVIEGLPKYTTAVCPSLKFISFPNNGKIDRWAIETIGTLQGPLNGTVWIAGPNNKLNQIGFTATALSTYPLYTTLISGNVELMDDVVVRGDIEMSPDSVLTGKLWGVDNGFELEYYTSCGTTQINFDRGIITINDPENDNWGNIIREISRVNGIGITGFTDGGKSAVVNIDAFNRAIPDGLMLVQYSVYTEVDGEQFLNPFKVAAVDVQEDSIITANVGERMLSCAVSYCYDFAGKEFWTPVSETAVMMPAEFVQIDAPEGVSMTIGNDVIENGEFLAFGTYSVKFTVPEGTQYELNGKLTSEIENFVYYGQDLVFTPVLAQA